MQIPSNILVKTNRFREKINRIIEEGWNYLQSYFRDENDYFNFLENISDDKFELFLYTIFFYWAHDLYRIVKTEAVNPNIDGFMYQITLSIIEYLNKDVFNTSKKRIKDFFTKYFSNSGKDELKNTIRARPIKDDPSPQIESWEILYDMRNKFVHEAGWFTMRLNGAFTSMGLMKRQKDETKYGTDIRIQYKGYLKLFWEAYLEYFRKR